MTDDGDIDGKATRRWETHRDQALQTVGGGTVGAALERLHAEHPTTMSAVLSHLHRRLSDSEIVAWLAAPDTWSCQGQRPLDLLGDDPDAVIEAARHTTADTWD